MTEDDEDVLLGDDEATDDDEETLLLCDDEVTEGEEEVETKLVVDDVDKVLVLLVEVNA